MISLVFQVALAQDAPRRSSLDSLIEAANGCLVLDLPTSCLEEARKQLVAALECSGVSACASPTITKTQAADVLSWLATTTFVGRPDDPEGGLRPEDQRLIRVSIRAAVRASPEVSLFPALAQYRDQESAPLVTLKAPPESTVAVNGGDGSYERGSPAIVQVFAKDKALLYSHFFMAGEDPQPTLDRLSGLPVILKEDRPFSPAHPKAGQAITLTVAAQASPLGHDPRVDCVWKVDGQTYSGVPGNSCELRGSFVRGQKVEVAATPRDSRLVGSSVPYTVTIQNSRPDVPANVTFRPVNTFDSPIARAGQPLLCDAAYDRAPSKKNDPDQEIPHFEYAFVLGDEPSEYSEEKLLVRGRTRAGEKWECSARATDGSLSSDPVDATVTIHSWTGPGLAWTGVGLSAVGVVGYGVSFALEQRYEDISNPNITTRRQLDTLRDTTNGLTIASASLFVAGVGLGISGALTWKF